MTDLYITGVAATPCGKYLEKSPKEIAAEAANVALADAGIGAEDVDAIVVGNAVAGLIGGQESIRGQAFLQGTELIGLPVFNVENACASGSSAFHMACQGIKAGTYETVLTIGVEKMTHEDKARSFSALEGALDVEEYPPEDGARKSSIFMDIYAMKAKKYMDAYGATKEDLAKVVSKNRDHAKLNPVAQYREPMTVEEVLEARPIVEPFTLPMCSPIGDGGRGDRRDDRGAGEGQERRDPRRGHSGRLRQARLWLTGGGARCRGRVRAGRRRPRGDGSGRGARRGRICRARGDREPRSRAAGRSVRDERDPDRHRSAARSRSTSRAASSRAGTRSARPVRCRSTSS